MKYNCTICNRAIGYEGLCWKCKAQKERDESLNLTESQIQEMQTYLINYDKCYSIEKKNTGDKAVVIGKIRKENCPHCGGKIVDILSVNGTDKRLEFLGVDGKITATCCPSCVMFTEAGFSRFQLDGNSEACFPYLCLTENEENYMLEENYEELENNGLELSETERPLFYDADNWEGATIGGFAHWIQDCIITKCPDCKVVSMHHQQT